jgi:TM2 domain-containing membrane protein YozV
MSGFGRNGLDGGATAATVPTRGFGAAAGSVRTAPDDGLSPSARAFIAAERARSGHNTDQGHVRAAAPMSAFESAALLQPATARPTKSLVVAYVLWWFGGPFGAHRFYLGAISSGLAMLGLLFGGFVMMIMSPSLGMAMVGGGLVWTLVDAFLIPGLRRRCEVERRTDGLAEVFA